MSALSPAAIQAIVTGIQAGRVAITAGCCAAALVIYDFFLSLSDEVKHAWQPKKTLVFALFTTLRYATLAYQITFNLAFFLPIRSNKGCAAIIYVEQVCFIFSSAALSGVFALRTFAIYQRNWLVLGILCLVASVKIFVSAIDFFVSARVAAQSGEFARFASCSETTPPSGARWNTASAALALLFDTIVIVLTITKTIRLTMEARELKMNKGMSYFILRDGLLYYFAIEVLLLSTVIFNQIPSLVSNLARVVIILQTSLAPILGQRLVLNLRNVTEKDGTPTHNSIILGDIQFACGPVIGNIGAPLRTELDADCEEEAVFAKQNFVPDEIELGAQTAVVEEKAEQVPGLDSSSTVGITV